MSKEIGTFNEIGPVESALVNGDLAKLTTDQRVTYYRRVCDSLGLNPLTQPFAYVTLNGKLQLYALKSCTDQLRTVRQVSITKLETEITDTHIIVTAHAVDATGRQDTDIGMVGKSSMNGDVANAAMKAVTKAKRRVTLSLCGLGMLDETEVETIAGAKVSMPDPAPVTEHVPQAALPAAQPTDDERRAAALTWLVGLGTRAAFSDAEHSAILRAAKLSGFTDDDIVAAKSTAEIVKSTIAALISANK